MRQVEVQELENWPDEKAFLSLFLSLKWALIVLCISIITSILVKPWFVFFGLLLAVALVLSDTRISSFFLKRLTRLLDSEYDEIEEMFTEIRPQLGDQYLHLLSQAIEIYREIRLAIRDRRGAFTESFGDVLPAIQALMEKIVHLTRKAQHIDNGLRCHDDLDRTRMVLEHYQQKIAQDRADDFIKSEWIRTRDSLIKQLKSQEEILRGKEYVQSKLTNIITSLREVHLSIIRLSFSEIHDGSDDLSTVFQTVMNLSEAIDDTVETLDKITYHRVA
ncbi:hypothetical protein GF339_17810 [candidate division KSB3 bacterium]|uniref:Uncharacterized protein n=1 Tax=candidate division KSB3 bacterium TaxID=2044937 RepID=A0A9D5Q737_9BACT|nr:hypothetical protein [candidate division KSB3 bacterium]MBD3326445.1 hypothetical protein [candidate division KSB3 bacterium]